MNASASEKAGSATIEELYLKEKKKSKMLLFGNILLGVFLVGSLMFGGGSQTGTATPDGRQGGQQDGQGGPGGRGQQTIATFFDENGDVDQTAVDAVVERFSQFSEEGFDSTLFLERLSPQIEAALESGEITQQQADALESSFNQMATEEA